MLEEIGSKDSIPAALARAKDKKDPFRLMGFGHRVYKSFDPRARVMRRVAHELLAHLNVRRARASLCAATRLASPLALAAAPGRLAQGLDVMRRQSFCMLQTCKHSNATVVLWRCMVTCRRCAPAGQTRCWRSPWSSSGWRRTTPTSCSADSTPT